MRGLVKSIVGNSLVTRFAARRGPASVLALMYHDLREDDDFGNWLRVRVSEFEAQLEMLGRLGRFVATDALADPDGLDPGRLNVLLTFDDGYANNHRLALPLLAKHRAPALFFVSTRHMQQQRPFWPDVVITAVQAGRLDALDLREFGLGEHRFRPGDGSGRWDDIQRLLVAIKAAGNADQSAVAALLDRLRDRHGDLLAEHLPRYRPLNAAEVREMADSGWCRFGGHGHDHDILTYLDDANLDYNLREPRRILEEAAGAPVVDLAYPNGDYDARVTAHALAAGYERAYTTRPGLARRETPLLSLPRLGVGGTEPLSVLRYQINRLLLEV
ncbi:polysaccharide deacetylase family protein [bacterium]|nr:polysaccharide deacetylase family protein [bacterium]MBU1676740.1 polysaccharide deacetylase family protein [bacterium]